MVTMGLLTHALTQSLVTAMHVALSHYLLPIDLLCSALLCSALHCVSRDVQLGVFRQCGSPAARGAAECAGRPR
jgi:hypothetical protein